MHSAEEKAVLDYLATGRNASFAAREVCRRAGTREMWEKNQRWAYPVLSRLVASGEVETDAAGHYRLAREDA